MALTHLQVQTVCNPPGPDMHKTCCRYLEMEWSGMKLNYMCTKLAKTQYDKLNKNRSHWQGKPEDMGDNCGGYLYLKHKKQGM